jgi:hypothetical protein
MAQTINLPLKDVRDDVDLRINEYFTDYFKNEIVIDALQYDIVKSFFMQRTNNNLEAAAALTSAVLVTCNELEVFPQDIITQFDNLNLQQSITAFLNLSRTGNGLLGFSKNLQPSANTQRQIRV